MTINTLFCTTLYDTQAKVLADKMVTIMYTHTFHIHHSSCFPSYHWSIKASRKLSFHRGSQLLTQSNATVNN